MPYRADVALTASGDERAWETRAPYASASSEFRCKTLVHLNGRRVFVRSTHTGNDFLGQVVPRRRI